MQFEMIVNIIGVLLSLMAGVWAGHSWGVKDGYRQRMLEEAFDQGQMDHGSRIEFEMCPYELDEEMIRQWELGWMNAEMDGLEHKMEMRRDLDEQ